MNQLHSFKGTLNSGYVGNIIYNLHLDQELTKLSILLTYDKEYITHIVNPDSSENNHKLSPDMEHGISKAYERHYGKPADCHNMDELLNSMKTEIQLAAFIDGQFAGNIHMPGTEKEILISHEEASFGCLPCKRISGMLKIVINVFSVLEDHTSYTLEICGE